MHDDRKTKPIHPNQGTPVRTRLLLLVLAGALLLSGAYYWVKALKEKEEPQPLVSMGEKLPASPGAVKSGPAAVPGPSRALPAAPPASPAAGSARPLTAAPPAIVRMLPVPGAPPADTAGRVSQPGAVATTGSVIPPAVPIFV